MTMLAQAAQSQELSVGAVVLLLVGSIVTMIGTAVSTWFSNRSSGKRLDEHMRREEAAAEVDAKSRADREKLQDDRHEFILQQFEHGAARFGAIEAGQQQMAKEHAELRGVVLADIAARTGIVPEASSGAGD